MASLTFTEYLPAHQSKTGKTVPPKLKTADGTEYACGKDVNLPLVIGQPYECVVTVKQSGQYTNHYLESAIPLVAAATPRFAEASSPLPANPPAPVDVQRLIVKQSCLKAAVDLVNAGNADKASLLRLANSLVDWVYGVTPTPQGVARRPDATTISPRTHPSNGDDFDPGDPGFLASLEESLR